MKLGYVGATAVQAGGSFIVVALLARLLGPVEFGIWSLIEPLLPLGAQIALLGATSGVIKLTAQEKIPAAFVVGIVFSRGWWLILLSACIFSIAAIKIFHLSVPWMWLGIYVLIESVITLLLSTCRGAGLSGIYFFGVAGRIASNIAVLCGAYFFSSHQLSTASHVLIAWAGVASFFALTLFLLVRKQNGERLAALSTIGAYKRAIRYGIPILGATVLAFIVANGDRYVLSHFVEKSAIGQYALIAKVVAALNLLVTPLNLWWPTVRFSRSSDPDQGAAFFDSAAMIICTFFALATGAIFLASPMILHIFSPDANFEPAVAGALCLASFFIALSTPMNIGALKEGHTHWLLIAVGIAAAVQIIASLVLIPIFGIVGAASSTAISSLVSLAVQNLVSQKIHYIPFKYFRLCAVGGYFALSVMMVRAVATDPLLQLVGFSVLSAPCVYSVFRVSWGIFSARPSSPAN